MKDLQFACKLHVCEYDSWLKAMVYKVKVTCGQIRCPILGNCALPHKNISVLNISSHTHLLFHFKTHRFIHLGFMSYRFCSFCFVFVSKFLRVHYMDSQKCIIFPKNLVCVVCKKKIKYKRML